MKDNNVEILFRISNIKNDLKTIKIFKDKYKERELSYIENKELNSLKKLEEDMVNAISELELLISDNDMEFVFDGEPVKNHTILISFLSDIFGKTQAVYNSLVQAFVQSDDLNEKPVKVDKNFRSDLYLASVAKSSFKIRLNKQDDTNNKLTNSQAYGFENCFINLLSGEDDTKSQKLLKNEIIRGRYSKFLDTIKKNNVTLKIRTKYIPKTQVINPEIAEYKIKKIEKTEKLYDDETETEKSISNGRITGLNISEGSFEIQVNNKKYKGEIDDRFLGDLKKTEPALNILVDFDIKIKIDKHNREECILMRYKPSKILF